MLHKMKLQKKPFALITAGNKTIEMRLNDEKRQKVKIGDLIEFTEVDSGKTALGKVTNLFRYKDFIVLYSNLDKVALGYKEDEFANPADMSVYYPDEDVKKYGALGIQIELIK